MTLHVTAVAPARALEITLTFWLEMQLKEPKGARLGVTASFFLERLVRCLRLSWPRPRRFTEWVIDDRVIWMDPREPTDVMITQKTSRLHAVSTKLQGFARSLVIL